MLAKSPDHLRADARFVDFVRRFNALKRPLAAGEADALLALFRSTRMLTGQTFATSIAAVSHGTQDAGRTGALPQARVDALAAYLRRAGATSELAASAPAAPTPTSTTSAIVFGGIVPRWGS